MHPDLPGHRARTAFQKAVAKSVKPEHIDFLLEKLKAVTTNTNCSQCQVTPFLVSYVLVVYAWFTCGSRQVHVWFTSGSCVVHVWFTCGSRQVHVWFMCGSRVVHVRFMCGSRQVHVWFTCD